MFYGIVIGIAFLLPVLSTLSEANQGVLVLECGKSPEVVHFPDGRSAPYRVPKITVEVNFQAQAVTIAREFQYLPSYLPSSLETKVLRERYSVESFESTPHFPGGCIRQCTAEEASVTVRLKSGESSARNHRISISDAKADVNDHRPSVSTFIRSWTDCYDSGDRGASWSCADESEKFEKCRTYWK